MSSPGRRRALKARDKSGVSIIRNWGPARGPTPVRLLAGFEDQSWTPCGALIVFATYPGFAVRVPRARLHPGLLKVPPLSGLTAARLQLRPQG